MIARSRSRPKPVLDYLQHVADGGPRARDVLDGFAARIERREPELRAFASLDLAVLREGRIGIGPLAGMPVGIKDIFETADFPTECGSAAFAGRRTEHDADVVACIRKLGGIVPGKTVTAECAFLTPGPTRNPWNAAHTPGGSSSGSAAAVAAGMLPLAIGTQTAGSVIRPASFCGVAGFKPTYGLVSTGGALAFSPSLDTVGFFAPTVADVAWFAGLVADRPLAVPPELEPPRLGRVRTHLDGEASADMTAALELAMQAAERAGATLVDIAWPEAFRTAEDAQPLVQKGEGARCLAGLRRDHADLLSPALRAALDEGAAISDEALAAANDTRGPAQKAAAALFEQCDAFLMPSAPGAAPHGIEATGSPAFNRLVTHLYLPAVSVPGLCDGTGLPLGIQVVGPLGEDARTLAAAAFVERALAGA